MLLAGAIATVSVVHALPHGPVSPRNPVPYSPLSPRTSQSPPPPLRERDYKLASKRAPKNEDEDDKPKLLQEGRRGRRLPQADRGRSEEARLTPSFRADSFVELA